MVRSIGIEFAGKLRWESLNESHFVSAADNSRLILNFESFLIPVNFYRQTK